MGFVDAMWRRREQPASDMLGNGAQPLVADLLPVLICDVGADVAHDVADSEKVAGLVTDGLQSVEQAVEVPMAVDLELVEQFASFFDTGLSLVSFAQLSPLAVINTRLACMSPTGMGRTANHSFSAVTVSGHRGQRRAIPVLGLA